MRAILAALAVIALVAAILAALQGNPWSIAFVGCATGLLTLMFWLIERGQEDKE